MPLVSFTDQQLQQLETILRKVSLPLEVSQPLYAVVASALQQEAKQPEIKMPPKGNNHDADRPAD